MQRTQIDFLNHGILPFVGRTGEMERIHRFWAGTADSPGMRAMMVTGEAGIGKSRLMEEITAHIAAAGGTVVQTKLYPDSTTSLAPLMARALARSAAAQQLLKSEPEENVTSAAQALVRICSLRPTLLVIEDLHLLTAESLHDFTTLLERLADEPLSLLCTARPVETPARGVLERFLVEEMELVGLTAEEIGTLCHSVFGERLDEEIVSVLRERTTGNSLALRSALRAALRPAAGSATRRAPAAGTVHIDHSAFVRALDRNVRLLSEGMAAHLTEREKDAAGMLAMLGEVFAREAAGSVLENAETMLEVLTFKGIITVSPTPPQPITRAHSSHPPLVFTHSLLHRHFLDQSRFSADAVVRLLSENRPLYSLLPVILLKEHAERIETPPREISRAVRRLFTVTSVLDNSRNWVHIPQIMESARAVIAAMRMRWDEDIRREIDIMLLMNELSIQRRARTSEYPRQVERALELTANPTSDLWAELRLRALVFQRRLYKRTDPVQCLALRAEVEALVEQFPAQRYSRPYVSHLRESMDTAMAFNDERTQREVESAMRRLVDDPATPEEIRFHAWRLIAPYLLNVFDSPEELQSRFQLLAELETSPNADYPPTALWHIGFVFQLGEFGRATQVMEKSLPMFTELGLTAEILTVRAIEAYIEIITTGNTGTMPEVIPALEAVTPQLLRHHANTYFTSHFGAALLMLDDPAALNGLLAHTGSPITALRAPQRILLAIANDNRADLEALCADPPAEAQELIVMTRALLEGDATSIERAHAAAAAVLEQHLLTTDRFLQARTAIDLVIAIDEAHEAGLLTRAEKDIRRGVAAMLQWLEERRIHTVMRRVVDRYERWMGKTEARAWRSKTTALSRQQDEERAAAHADQRVRVSMFGTISIQKPGEPEPARVRGTQLCALLGLMAADCTLAKPLTQNEMASIVFGSERDPDSVRKSMNFAVFRLREMLGTDAISTTGETPLLNTELVEVDLVTAHRHVSAAADAIRDGALLRALPELTTALKLSAGQVPFPTLYDEFFEAAREDFENALRETVIRLVRALNREGDNIAAEDVLRLAFTSMPDDEEIAELLQETLVALGKRTEAKRVGMRMEMSSV